MQNKDWTGAIAAYLKGLKKEPKNANVWNNVGAALLNIKQYAEAYDACRKALAINPKHALAWNNLGSALLNINKYPEAVDAYRKAVALDPRPAIAWNNLGKALNNTKQYLDAIDACRKALAIDPNFVLAWSNLGIALEATRQFEEALAAFQKANKLNPLPEYQQSVERLKKVAKPAVKPAAKTAAKLAAKPAPVSTVDQKKRLYGMIKSRKKVDIDAATKILNMSRNDIEVLIYDLVGEGKIEGEFQDNEFIIKSDVERFIASLDGAFADWGKKTETKDGKLE